jgi:hypothetical protein
MNLLELNRFVAPGLEGDGHDKKAGNAAQGRPSDDFKVHCKLLGRITWQQARHGGVLGAKHSRSELSVRRVWFRATAISRGQMVNRGSHEPRARRVRRNCALALGAPIDLYVARGILRARRRRRLRVTSRRATLSSKKTTRPITKERNQPDRADVVVTGGDDPILGKVMVACALRWSSPLSSVTLASQGPSGICPLRAIVTGSVSPIASVVPRVARNGPALSPPGPAESCNVPLMSRANAPVLRTLASTVGVPVDERSAVSESMVKLDAGAPPDPTER